MGLGGGGGGVGRGGEGLVVNAKKKSVSQPVGVNYCCVGKSKDVHRCCHWLIVAHGAPDTRRQRSGWKSGAIRLARDSTDVEITMIPVIISQWLLKLFDFLFIPLLGTLLVLSFFLSFSTRLSSYS